MSWNQIFILIFTSIVVALWLGLSYATIRSLVKWRLDLRQSPEEIPATVQRLYEQEEYIHTFGSKVVANHIAEFLTQDGRTLSFSLSPPAYRALQEGACGLLKLRNDDYAGFDPQTETGQRPKPDGSDPNEVLRRIVKQG